MDDEFYRKAMAQGFEEYKEHKVKNVAMKKKMLSLGLEPSDPRFALLDKALAECRETLILNMEVMGYTKSDFASILEDIDREVLN